MLLLAGLEVPSNDEAHSWHHPQGPLAHGSTYNNVPVPWHTYNDLFSLGTLSNVLSLQSEWSLWMQED